VYSFTTILEKVGGDVVGTKSRIHTKLEAELANIISTERGRFSHIRMWSDVSKVFLHVMFMFNIM
jgi:hypothetical protein